MQMSEIFAGEIGAAVDLHRRAVNERREMVGRIRFRGSLH